MMIPLTAYLVVAAILFAIGVYTVIAQRSAVMVLMGIEVLLTRSASISAVSWGTR